MLPKTPKSSFWKFVKGSAKTLFVIEAVCFAASYGVYYRMNTNRGTYLHIISPPQNGIYVIKLTEKKNEKKNGKLLEEKVVKFI